MSSELLLLCSTCAFVQALIQALKLYVGPAS
jgi:hypothetical protein